MNTGLVFESYKWKDISHERVFGSAPKFGLEIKPLGRDISGIPVVYQGNQNTCVACSITWLRQWMEKDRGEEVKRLSWPFLSELAKIGPYGAKPSQVLEPARKKGISTWDSFDKDGFEKALEEAFENKIPNYSFITDYSQENLYQALTRSPLLVGVLNWKGRGAHMMVALDTLFDFSALKVVSFDDEDHQTEDVLPWEQVELAISFEPFPEYSSSKQLTIHWGRVLADKLVSYFKYVQTN